MIYVKQPVLTGKDVSPTTDVSVLTIFFKGRPVLGNVINLRKFITAS